MRCAAAVIRISIELIQESLIGKHFDCFVRFHNLYLLCSIHECYTYIVGAQIVWLGDWMYLFSFI